MKEFFKGYPHYKIESGAEVAMWFLTIGYDNSNEITIYDKRNDPTLGYLPFRRKPSEKAEPVFMVKQTYRNTISYHEDIISAINECYRINFNGNKFYHIEVDWDELQMEYYQKKWNRLRLEKIKKAQEENRKKRDREKKSHQGSPRKRGRPKGSKNKKR